MIWRHVLRILILLLLVSSFDLHAASPKGDYLKKYCDNLGGKIVNRYKCPDTGLIIPFKYCVFKNELDETLFFDGCTGPSGGNIKRFIPHCINHDFCYHHEPITSGKDQRKCDLEFRDGMIESCKDAPKKKSCVRWAKTMYSAVKAFGKLGYLCANYEVNGKIPDFSVPL